MPQNMTDVQINRHPLLKKLLRGEILIYRRSFLDYVQWWLLLFISLVAIFSVYIFLPEGPISSPFELFIPLAILAAIFHKKYDRKYVVSKNGIAFNRGLISLRKLERAISYSKMRNVEVKQNLWQRLLNVADLGVTTILGDQPEIDLKGIYRPKELTAVIEFFIAQNALQFSKQSGGNIEQQIPTADYAKTTASTRRRSFAGAK